MISIKDFIRNIGLSAIGRECIPLDTGYGLPMLEMVGDRLLVSVFFYRTVPGKRDTTKIYPPQLIISADYPGGKIMRMNFLAACPEYCETNFDLPIGTFRHEAIKHLDKGQYKEKKNELFALIDKQIAYIGGEGHFTREDASVLRSLYTMLAEPSLYPYYKLMSGDFFEQYFGDGSV